MKQAQVWTSIVNLEQIEHAVFLKYHYYVAVEISLNIPIFYLRILMYIKASDFYQQFVLGFATIGLTWYVLQLFFSVALNTPFDLAIISGFTGLSKTNTEVASGKSGR